MTRRCDASGRKDILGAVGNAVQRAAAVARHDLALSLARVRERNLRRCQDVGVDLGIKDVRAIEQCLRQLDRRQRLAPDQLGGFRNR
jgi:hypothetical protein